MWFKYPLIILLFFLFALLQVSFLPHFSIMGVVPNLVFILFFLFIFFERENQGGETFFTVIIAGFFLDIFSTSFLGKSILLLLVMYLFLRAVTHFLKQKQGKYIIVYFMGLFSLCFVLYALSMYSLFSISIFLHLICNLLFALIGFYVYKIIYKNSDANNQLKLL
ncbi:MAG: hypothetical protein UR46_C0024G0004 [Parcubacteria group bacterium GW2011_GWA1_33_6]|uniref:Rod shape-determining protein MreD n=1 Tax=Candidatus Staskawiczbacteria bacterium RIFCSPHIGHO2_02_FULL_33_16 TaxID=1802204 RepID=A0A1G2HYN2_9BACT|nr:MAG: hypothetical protein UR46_C0024G0004 [Parcubacteria group bacterium GW2011_GWA1_33_6]OGZ67654.1 MAG: hypothetical protein A3D34_01920 [Candidatus Staskawiczbacteria bacterium RIFCSPHIGHO2_02_FULL_33_16]OGZ70426.1 MAG: hypothetical protein A2980_00690 [Candidatus Staskawiczbacteria bacterium RIFCSPLOWO2_01_FULL_33_13]